MSLKAKLLAGCGGSPTDPNFKNVALLLPGNGSNGAQNNTFLDSSTNNFTITRNGNTTQGSFSPYGSYWSNYFDGSSYLTVANNTALDVWDSGSGSFTVEAWIFATASISNNVSIISKAPNNGLSSWSPGWAFQVFNGYLNVNTPGDVRLFNSNTTSVPLNQWVHCALVKSGSTVSIYQNGTRVGTITNSTAYSNTSDAVAIAVDRNFAGSKLTGYVSNARMVKGTAVYDPTQSTLTVPTAPLTAISGTSLLTCQSNRFRDNSSNAFAITVNGNTSVSRFSPFSPASAYSTTANGGSAYFDGSGDWLSAPSNTAFAFGTGDFTIEAWVFRPTTGDATIISPLGGPSPIFYNVSQLRILDTNTGNPLLTDPDTFPLNQWVHVACTRASGTMRLFVNGALKASGTVTNNFTSIAPCYVGSWDGTNFNWNGSISNARIVKGTAVYTAAFTPPTAPVTAISGTSLLVNATNAAIFDNAMINDLETVGNAQVSTAQSKFGGSSMYFDGTGDYLVTPANNAYALGGSSFTVEAWVYVTSSSEPYQAITKVVGSGGNNLMFIDYSGGANGVLTSQAGGTSATRAGVTLNTWHHVAVVRNGTSVTCYVNGVGGTPQTIDPGSTGSVSLMVGYDGGTSPARYFNGYIDDLRITKGVARYTANFTPPTAAFPVQ